MPLALSYFGMHLTLHPLHLQLNIGYSAKSQPGCVEVLSEVSEFVALSSSRPSRCFLLVFAVICSSADFRDLPLNLLVRTCGICGAVVEMFHLCPFTMHVFNPFLWEMSLS